MGDAIIIFYMIPVHRGPSLRAAAVQTLEPSRAVIRRVSRVMFRTGASVQPGARGAPLRRPIGVPHIVTIRGTTFLGARGTTRAVLFAL